MRELSVAYAKQHFSEVLARVAFARESFLVRRRGKAMALIVSPESLPRRDREALENPWLALRSAGGRAPGLSKAVLAAWKDRRRAKARWKSPLA